MTKLMYEFDSVEDRATGRNKLYTESRYANPVNIVSLLVGQRARFQYADADSGFNTSNVDYIHIHNDNIYILTRNTSMWLKPYIRKESN